jgi:hypothetical protein
MTQPVQPKTKQKKDARDIRSEALKITNSIKSDGQTNIETKAIADGIQRGMELFLRQQSEKTRELDKRVKKVKKLSTQLAQEKPADEKENLAHTHTSTRLPWILLTVSWIAFLAFALIQVSL